MGVRLIRFDKKNLMGGPLANEGDHDDLINRDLFNQHPIYAITGLQEVLNTLEDADKEIIQEFLDREDDTNERIDNVNLNIQEIKDSITEVNDRITKLTTIDKTITSSTVEMNYNPNDHSIISEVIVYDDKAGENNLIKTSGGLFVPKIMTEDSPTIKWGNRYDTETLESLYHKGNYFKHYPGIIDGYYTDPYVEYFDDIKGLYIGCKDSYNVESHGKYIAGRISKKYYDEYDLEIKITGSDGTHGRITDENMNGSVSVIIAYITDKNNKVHTVSAVCDLGLYGIKWGLVYDFMLPTQQYIVVNKVVPKNIPSSWKNSFIKIKVSKHEECISAMCSDYNSEEYNTDTYIEIYTSTYEWGSDFGGDARFGFGDNYNRCLFADLKFTCVSQRALNTWSANVQVANEQDNQIIVKPNGIYVAPYVISPQPNNALEKKYDGYWVEKFNVSKDKNNCIEKRNDGYYIEKNYNVFEITDRRVKGWPNEGDFISFDYKDEYYCVAKAIDNGESNVIGIIIKKTENPVSYKILTNGFWETELFNDYNKEHPDKAFKQGMPLYLSDTKGGKCTQTQPKISIPVGIPISNKGIYVNIQRGIDYNQQKEIGDFKIAATDYNMRSDGYIRIIENVEYDKLIIERLLTAVSDEFKKKYMIIEEEKISFVNTDELLLANKTPKGLSLYIKAF